MDVREKLVELLGEVQETGVNEIPAGFGCTREYVKNEMVASHLIANGVTVHENVKMSDELLKQLKNAPITICKEKPSIELVQEWISADDELPEVGGYVVCIAKRNPFSGFMPMVARIEKNGWVNPITDQYISDATHWMPLPNPPKGE